MNKSTILKSIAAFFVWLVVCGLGLVILGLGRQLILLLLVSTLHVYQFSVAMWVNLYMVVAGLLWMGLFMLMENRLSNAIKKNHLLSTSLFSIGLSFLVMVFLQILLTAYGTMPANTLQIGITILEILAGAGMVYASKRIKPGLAGQSV
jgi:hypothetical protein